jgi:hypothetical protein
MAKTPDAILKEVLIGLATNDFEGINAKDFWRFVTELCGDLDEFTKTIVWSWLLKEPDFQVLRSVSVEEQYIDDSKKKIKTHLILEEKNELPDFQSFFDDDNIGDYIIKVSDNYQSLYLTGVKQTDNVLGRMPYDLLRIIAKHKEKGINSINLVKEANQDNRSLTTRLQVLEDNLLIVKYPVCINRANTNHMVHFRFIAPKKNDSKSDEPKSDFYDRYLAMTQIIDALKAESSNIRLTNDLYIEIKESQPILKIRWFNKIINFLVQNGFIELIQVEHTEMKRFFPAVRFLKDLPPVSKKTELLDILREQGLDSNNSNIDDDEGDDDEQVDQPQFTRFFPLTTQIHSLIEKNPGIMTASIDRELAGIYRAKPIDSIIESIASVTPDPSNPNSIIAQLFQTGKTKFYRFTTQNILNRRDPDYKFEIPDNDKINEPNKTTLFEENLLNSANNPVERRLRFVSISDEENKDYYFIIPKGYGGKIGLGLASNIPSRLTLEGHFKSENSLIIADLIKSKLLNVVKDIDTYKKYYKLEQENLLFYNEIASNTLKKLENVEELSNSLSSNVFQDLQFISQSSNNEDLKESKSKESDVIMDYGPEFRRQKLMEFIDKNKCVCINTELSLKLTSLLKLDYRIDRRTLARDAQHLLSKELIDFETLDNGKMIAKSLKHPPTKEDIDSAIVGVSRSASRKFTTQVKLQNIYIRDTSVLTRGLKFANKESRLENAMAKLSQAAKRKPLGKKIKVLGGNLNENEMDVDENENENVTQDEQVDQRGIESKRKNKNKSEENEEKAENLFEPIMGDKKRIKLKTSATKSQVRVIKAFKKIRTSIKITNDHILILIKAITVTQSLSTNGNIDWPKVSNVLDGLYDPDTLRRQWPKHKKMLGARNLMAAKKNWENALLHSISIGTIKEKDLEDYDIFRLLDIWKSEGADIFLNRAENEIQKNYEDNFVNQVFKPLKQEFGIEVVREPASIIEKEHLWTSRNFMYPIDDKEISQLNKECENPTMLQIAKTKLKALFATNKNKFDSTKVRELFANIPKELYSQALTELEDKKAIAFLGEDSKIKFTLTDKIMSLLDCKLDDEFVNGAKQMLELLNDTATSSSGILLSTRCPNGAYAPILTLFSRDSLVLTRIDQSVGEIDTYYTKSRDRARLESDFLLSHFNNDEKIFAKKVAIPIDKSCSYFWIDLSGDLNVQLWHKCIYVILWTIVLNPGTTIDILCRRIYPLLEPFEVKKLLDWLVLRGNVINNEFGGFLPTECWFDVE